MLQGEAGKCVTLWDKYGTFPVHTPTVRSGISPSHFLEGYGYLFRGMDDILIKWADDDNYLQTFRQVLSRLQEAELKLKPERYVHGSQA